MRLAEIVYALGIAAVTTAAVTAVTQVPDMGRIPGRRYEDGERLAYLITAEGRRGERTTRYSAVGKGVVRRDDQGDFVEEFEWTELVLNGSAVELPPASRAFRQVVSLDPGRTPVIPDLATAHPGLIGPITDFLTFYADVWLAARQSTLQAPGDSVRIPHGRPNTWADGTRVLQGEDAIDFLVRVERVDTQLATIELRVRHVPPADLSITLPAEWMREPVMGVPNNWMQVVRDADGGVVASVGREVFDVRVELDAQTGRIRSAALENVIDVSERRCDDTVVARCGPRTRYEIRRFVRLEEAADTQSEAQQRVVPDRR